MSFVIPLIPQLIISVLLFYFKHYYSIVYLVDGLHFCHKRKETGQQLSVTVTVSLYFMTSQIET